MFLFLNGFSKGFENPSFNRGLEFCWIPAETTNDEIPGSNELPVNEPPYEQSESPNDYGGIVHQLTSQQILLIRSKYPLQAHSLSVVYWEISTPPPKF